MGAAKAIRHIMLDKSVSLTGLAEQMGKPRSTVANTFQKDSMSIASVLEYAEALGCDLVLIDRETGKQTPIVK